MVIAGKSRGEKGTVMRAMPKENKVIIEGVNMMKKHQKATRSGGKGQLVERAMPLHVSNVQVVDPKTGKGTRVRITREKGGMARVAVKSGSTLK